MQRSRTRVTVWCAFFLVLLQGLVGLAMRRRLAMIRRRRPRQNTVGRGTGKEQERHHCACVRSVAAHPHRWPSASAAPDLRRPRRASPRRSASAEDAYDRHHARGALALARGMNACAPPGRTFSRVERISHRYSRAPTMYTCR